MKRRPATNATMEARCDGVSSCRSVAFRDVLRSHVPTKPYRFCKVQGLTSNQAPSATHMNAALLPTGLDAWC